MKIRFSLLLALALSVGACQRGRLSPVVGGTSGTSQPSVSADALAASEKAAKVADAKRLAAKRKRLSAASRVRMKKLASASLEAGRQLLRDSLDESALKAFREAVRLNSRSAEAWLGIAYV